MAQAALTRPETSTTHSNWLGIGLLVVIVALVAGLAGFAFGQIRATNPVASFQTDFMAAWNNTSDAAKVAQLYAVDAVLRNGDTAETTTGLPAIQAYIADQIASATTVTPIGEPIRSGDTIANFANVSFSGTSTPYLSVIVFDKDGKIATHTFSIVH